VARLQADPGGVLRHLGSPSQQADAILDSAA